jgi:Leucine-rich repeat (LRR) protein
VLDTNFIESVNPSITNLVSLIELRLTHNCLDHFPIPVCFLHSLKYVSFEGLGRLDAGGWNVMGGWDETRWDGMVRCCNKEPYLILPHLSRKLSVGGNLISDLPTEIRDLTNLEELHASKNRIKTVPQDIAQLTSLTKLSLAGNLIDDCNMLSSLTNLVSLTLFGNPCFASIPGLGVLENTAISHFWQQTLTESESSSSGWTGQKKGK